jgi:hypothetical protein
VKLEQISRELENKLNINKNEKPIQQLEIIEEENSASNSTNFDKPTTQKTTESLSNSSVNETESTKNSPSPVREKVKMPSVSPPVEEISNELNHSLGDRHPPIAFDRSTLLQADRLEDFLTSIQTLIDSNDYKCVLVGLMASTGLDAASLLKLLVFKEAAAPHLILYCQQLHPSHQPLQQLLTLLDSEVVLKAIAQIRRDRDAIDFAHCLTGGEINHEVQQFTPDVLSSVGLPTHLDLRKQYHALIPLLLTENIGASRSSSLRDRYNTFSVSEDTYSKIEQWQQRIDGDLDTTLNELMVLASRALSDRDNQTTALLNSDRSSPSEALVLRSNKNVSPPTNSHENSPWSAVSQLANTVNLLAERVIRQSDLLFDVRFQKNDSYISKPHMNRGVSSNPSNSDSASKQKTNSVIKSSEKGTNSSVLKENLIRDNSSDDSQVKTDNSKIKSSSHEDSSNLSVDETLKNMSSDELRASRVDGAPIEKCDRALAAVIQYNQQQEKPEQMWRINTSLLQQLTGSFNSNVKKFVKAHQKAIDEHNHSFGLTLPRHNGVHNDTDPNDLIHW